MDKINLEFDFQIYAIQKFGGITRYFNELQYYINQYNSNNFNIINYHKQNHYFSNKILNKLNFNYNLFNFNYLSKNKAHILHKTYYFNNSLLLSKRYKKQIITIFDCIHEKNLIPISDKKKSIFLNYKKKSIENTDHLICISENTKKDLIKYYGVSKNKISVTHLGISNIFLKKNYSSLKINFNIPNEYILFVGNRQNYKNSQILLKSFAQISKEFKDLHLVFFGGPRFSKSELKYIDELNIDQKKIKHFYGSDKTLKYMYQNAKLFVYPTKYEGFGLPPLESMASKCPVITTKGGSLYEICGDSVKYFDPNNDDELSDIIINIIKNHDLANELINLGLERIKNFSWQKCCDETVKIYKSISI